MLTNTTQFHEVLIRIAEQFDILYSKKVFMDFYLREGMEEDGI